MDRDRRWDRTKRAYDAIVHGVGERRASGREAVQASYDLRVTDEFIEPAVIGDPAENRVRPGDAVLYWNFRPDRARQLTMALSEPDFDGFDRGAAARPALTTITRYKAEFHAPVLFEAQDVRQGLAETVSCAGRRQLHVAETEKYAHVTYYFSGGRETPLAGEERCLVPSPRVATYDLAPAMSAVEVTDALVARLAAADPPALVVLNFANADMVGHTGHLGATVQAVEVLDACLARIEAAVRARDGWLVITADHGNAERMWDETRNEPFTAHTTNPVPLVLVGGGEAAAGHRLRDGRLADVAPTLLELLGIPAPAAMTGRSLLER
jgi:2,3-bisphosphoglycerate-independent phosphoglycerate mutase